MAVNGNASGDPTALRFASPRPADEVIEQTFKVPEDLRGQVMVVPFQGLVDWARKNSMWPVTFGLAAVSAVWGIVYLTLTRQLATTTA